MTVDKIIVNKRTVNKINRKQKNDPKQGTLTEREGSVHLTSVY